MTVGQEEVVFEFDLTAGPTACFEVQAFSGAEGDGTLIYHGTASEVDLTLGGTIEVEVDLEFFQAAPPTATTLAPSGLGSVTVTLEGTVNPRGFATVGYFEWGTTDAYGSATPPIVVGAGIDEVPISQLISGLSPGQSYHFRSVALSSGGPAHGGDRSFTTAAADAGVVITFPDLPPPAVRTIAATSVTASSALLNADVNALGTEAYMHFEWGVDVTYGTSTAPQAVGSGSTTGPFQAALTGLVLGTEYHFRAVAYNAGGLTLGPDRAFTSASAMVDVVFVVDGGASMLEEIDDFENEINGFASAVSVSNDLRVVLIGESTICVPAPLGSDSCPGDGNGPGYTHIEEFVGSRDALAQILATSGSWMPILRTQSTKVFVVLSDDDSSMDAVEFDTDLRALDPMLSDYRFGAYVADYDGSSLDPCYPRTPGLEYIALATHTGGVLGNLCDQDIVPFLADLAAGL